MDGHAKRVMVVDDDERIALSLAIRLRAAGREVETVHSGSAALEAARACPPDAILLDVSMPDTDGFTLAERLREEPATSATPLVFLTASKREALRARAAEVGAAGFFEKPYDSEALLAHLAQLLDPAA